MWIGAHPAPAAQSTLSNEQITAIAKTTAIAVGKNADVSPELCFPHIYLMLKDLLTAKPNGKEGA